jgi:hypothetical protein
MESKPVLPEMKANITNQHPSMFHSKISGGADVRPEPLRYGFSGESVSPGKAIFAGGKRKQSKRKQSKRKQNKRQQKRKSRRNR